jgi:hypothetical protein
MKNIIKCLGLLAIVFTLFSCDEESNFLESEIDLVSVYAITDISGGNTPVAINIYQQQNLIVEYISAVNLTSYVSSSFADTSTDTTYEFSVAKIVDIVDEEGKKTGEEVIGYWVSADKTTGAGTLTVVSDIQEVYQIQVSVKEVLN